MKEELILLYHQVSSIAFWEHILGQFQALGPAVPILLAALESVIPPLPLVAIVTLNVTAHGAFLGFLYSWIGTCIGATVMFFFYRVLFRKLLIRVGGNHEKVRKAREWVGGVRPFSLFLIAILPFTPSSFLNFAFGISDYSAKTYLGILLLAKVVMIGALAFFGQSLISALDQPLFIVLAIAVVVALYVLSRIVMKKNNLEE